MRARDVRRVPVRHGAGGSYLVEIDFGLLSYLGRTARTYLPEGTRRVAVISNQRVFDLYGKLALRSLRAAGYQATYWLMGDGERYKSLRTAERALGFLSASGVGRADAVLALGGGVVGDLAGFAAAIHLRGVPLLQVPTTLLAQIDSSIGGKTGVNTRDGKNLVGAFHQPRAVVVDTGTLRTLPARELTAGWCEAIKHGAVGDRKLFERTRDFLVSWRRAVRDGGRESSTPRGSEAQLAKILEAQLVDLIGAHCAFKARVVAGDEREEVGRTDAGSRRTLNFGHTIGHALENVAGYGRLRHGEAVGYGMLAAADVSVKLGLLDRAEAEALADAVHLAGRLPRTDHLDQDSILRALRADKKSVGGSIRWVLLERIGRARIVDGSRVPERVVRAAIRSALGTARNSR